MSQLTQICDSLSMIKNNTKMKKKKKKERKKERNKIVSMKYIYILNCQNSYYHNKHFSCSSTNASKSFLSSRLVLLHSSHSQKSVQGGKSFKKYTHFWLHTLNEHQHVRNSNTYNINSRLWCCRWVTGCEIEFW